ncbi:Transcription-silencing Clr2 [Cordyceps militaris]|uniref:Transcription-silencing Clr2 n=1 Tax=Cordyceps militaris TaxID=73501 RepID=A0A2H4SM28_CORMI|nr:Transcription-silencing Clr2 [Cordyceps militaris]
MADLKEFDVVRVARSDGADTGPGYWPVTAPAPKKPTKEATDKAPRSKPQMIRLAHDDPRYIEWKVKLGIILKMELSPHPDEGNSWFVDFPRGYWPYEKSKHIWVSGYPVKSKLFKTPQEFAAHLIWLLSSSKEYKDCCCVHCNSPNVAKLAAALDETSSTPTLQQVQPEKALPKVTPVPLPTIPGQPAPRQTESVPKVQPVQAKPESKAAAQAQTQAAAQQEQLKKQQAERQARQPTHLTSQQQTQQQRNTGWSLQSPILFRVGEQVWFQNGNTWRLGIIASQNPQQPGVHELLPLGSGVIPQQNVAKHDKDMRPFQAFSVPPVAIQELDDKTFDEIPWAEKFREFGADPSKRDLLLLDASKLAASKVDWSNSLWSAMSEDVHAKTITYYGCFLGAERIEVGDCLRVRNLPLELSVVSEDLIVMGLRFIYTSGDFPGTIFFRGTLYQRADPGADPSTLVPMQHLPIALRDETHWRSQVQPGTSHGWIVVGDGVRLKEKSIRGRLYPAHRVMPILNPSVFEAAVARRQIDDQHPYLNSRMDGVGRYLGRQVNRLLTLGASVPAGARLNLEPFVREDMRRA